MKDFWKRLLICSFTVSVALILRVANTIGRILISSDSSIGIVGGADLPTFQFVLNQAARSPSGIWLRIALLVTIISFIGYLIEAKKEIREINA